MFIVPCEEYVTAVTPTFNELLAKWNTECSQISSMIRDRVTHPAYMSIIGLGPPAVPLILKELENGKSNAWFSALIAITGEYLIPEVYQGNIPEMSRLWLEWGQRTGVYGHGVKLPRLLDQAVEMHILEFIRLHSPVKQELYQVIYYNVMMEAHAISGKIFSELVARDGKVFMTPDGSLVYKG